MAWWDEFADDEYAMVRGDTARESLGAAGEWPAVDNFASGAFGPEWWESFQPPEQPEWEGDMQAQLPEARFVDEGRYAGPAAPGPEWEQEQQAEMARTSGVPIDDRGSFAGVSPEGRPFTLDEIRRFRDAYEASLDPGWAQRGVGLSDEEYAARQAYEADVPDPDTLRQRAIDTGAYRSPSPISRASDFVTSRAPGAVLDAVGNVQYGPARLRDYVDLAADNVPYEALGTSYEGVRDFAGDVGARAAPLIERSLPPQVTTPLRGAGAALDFLGADVDTEDIGRFAGESAVPEKNWELAAALGAGASRFLAPGAKAEPFAARLGAAALETFLGSPDPEDAAGVVARGVDEFAEGASRNLPELPNLRMSQALKVGEEPANTAAGVARRATEQQKPLAQLAGAADDDEIVQKLTDLVAQAKPLPEQTEVMRTAERGARITRSAELLKQGGATEEAFERAKAALGGELPRASFDPVDVAFDEVERQALRERIVNSGLDDWEHITAKEALNKVLSGDLSRITPNELGLLDRVYGNDLTKAILKNQPTDWWAEAAGVLSIPQTLSATGDLSAPLRQGLVLGLTHPVEWFKSWAPMIKAGISEADNKALDVALRRQDWVGTHSDPTRAHLAYNRVGGHLSSASAYANEHDREAARAMMGNSKTANLVRNTPGVRASERAYSTFLNQLRGKVYAQQAQKMWDAGVTDPKQYRAMADVINHASGWSKYSVGGVEAGRIAVNSFFAPRLMMSRFETALDVLRQPGSLLKPSARQQAAKNLAGLVAVDGGMITAIAGLTGAGLTWNPVDTDFGKLQYGKTRVDLMGGFGPMIRTIARVGTGGAVSSSGGKFSVSPEEGIWDFLRNKESPIAALATDIITGHEAGSGKKVEATPKYALNRAYRMIAPFFAQDVIEAYQQGGVKAAALTAPAFFGAGAMTYETPAERAQRYIREDIERGSLSATYTDATGQQQPLKNYSQLTKEQRLAFDQQHDDYVKARTEASSEPFQRLNEELGVYADMQVDADKLPFGEKWRGTRSQIQAAQRGAVDSNRRQFPDVFEELDKKKPETMERLAVKTWTDSIDKHTGIGGAVDWQAVDRDIATWPEVQQKALASYRQIGTTSKETEYITDIGKLKPYFDARDDYWEKMRTNNPDLKPYESLEQAAEARLMQLAKANPFEPIENLRASVASEFMDEETALSDAAGRALEADLSLVPLLSKHEFYVPSRFRNLSPRAGQWLQEEGR